MVAFVWIDLGDKSVLRQKLNNTLLCCSHVWLRTIITIINYYC